MALALPQRPAPAASLHPRLELLWCSVAVEAAGAHRRPNLRLRPLPPCLLAAHENSARYTLLGIMESTRRHSHCSPVVSRRQFVSSSSSGGILDSADCIMAAKGPVVRCC